MITEEELVIRLKHLVAETSQKELAVKLGISPQYLNDIISYRRSAGKKACQGLGLRKMTVYMPLYLIESDIELTA